MLWSIRSIYCGWNLQLIFILVPKVLLNVFYNLEFNHTISFDTAYIYIYNSINDFNEVLAKKIGRFSSSIHVYPKWLCFLLLFGNPIKSIVTFSYFNYKISKSDSTLGYIIHLYPLRMNHKTGVIQDCKYLIFNMLLISEPNFAMIFNMSIIMLLRKSYLLRKLSMHTVHI